ncbi:MAG: 2-dehydropantoate 2-reductase [Candidatus Omnitrophica bacterium]|nr:2-dehydropantoate 2-reductase [Candidatus Omnitrophota bacterium]
MTICIVGPGAIGSLFYFFLSKKIKDLQLLDKDKERASCLKAKGLTILKENKSYKIPLNITAQASEITKVDLFIISVKSYDTLSAAKLIKPLCGKDTFVLSLQNGLGNLEVLSEVLGEEKVLGAVTHNASTLIEDGIIRYAASGQTIIGKKGNKLPAVLRQIRTLFNSCGISTNLSKDLDSVIWSKLVINIAINPLTAVLRVKNGDLLKTEEARTLLQMASSEAERIARKKRIKLLYDDTQTKVEAVCRATSNNVSSMLQDTLKRNKTEIDFLNGAICRLGQNLKIATPVNFMLYQLVKTIEQSYSQLVQADQ